MNIDSTAEITANINGSNKKEKTSNISKLTMQSTRINAVQIKTFVTKEYFIEANISFCPLRKAFSASLPVNHKEIKKADVKAITGNRKRKKRSIPGNPSCEMKPTNNNPPKKVIAIVRIPIGPPTKIEIHEPLLDMPGLLVIAN